MVPFKFKYGLSMSDHRQTIFELKWYRGHPLDSIGYEPPAREPRRATVINCIHFDFFKLLEFSHVVRNLCPAERPGGSLF